MLLSYGTDRHTVTEGAILAYRTVTAEFGHRGEIQVEPVPQRHTCSLDMCAVASEVASLYPLQVILLFAYFLLPYSL